MISSPLDNVAKIDDLFAGYTFCAFVVLHLGSTLIPFVRSRQSRIRGEGSNPTLNRRTWWTCDAEASSREPDSIRRLLRSEVGQ